jgi:hypothetical protein
VTKAEFLKHATTTFFQAQIEGREMQNQEQDMINMFGKMMGGEVPNQVQDMMNMFGNMF